MEYGISILGVIPLRKEPKDQSEIVSQVLFGQHFKILEVKPKWINIELASDNYQGWICAKQYHEITYEDYDNLSINDFPLVAESFSSIKDLQTNELIPVPMGAILPYFHQGNLKIRNKKFNYSGVLASKDPKDIVSYAKQLINAPYLWGGKSILGIDCSGFTQLIYGLCGITLPRDAYQQIELGEEIDFSAIECNDLVFFENDKGRIHHVGIALGNNQIIHASGNVRIDELSTQGIIHNTSKKVTHKYHSVKRLS